MTNATDALRALLQEAHACALSHLGLLVVNNMTDGVEETKALIGQLEQALATPAGSASGGDDALDYQMAASAEAAEVDRRGKRIAALQAEVARLREDAARYRWLVENAVIETDAWRHDGRDAASTKQPLDNAIDAAMGSANGQG